MIYRKVPPVPVHVSTSPGPQSSRSRGDLEPGRPRARRRQVQDQGTDGRGRRARGARRSQGHGTRAVTVRGPLNHSTAAGGRAGNNLFPSRGCARGPAGRPVDGSADPRAPALIRVLAGYGWTAQRHGARRPRQYHIQATSCWLWLPRILNPSSRRLVTARASG
jgi:hypothetical protein